MTYHNVGVPEVLSERIERAMEKSKGGYRSRSEFVIEAIREKLERIDKLESTAGLQEAAKA